MRRGPREGAVNDAGAQWSVTLNIVTGTACTAETDFERDAEEDPTYIWHDLGLDLRREGDELQVQREVELRSKRLARETKACRLFRVWERPY